MYVYVYNLQQINGQDMAVELRQLYQNNAKNIHQLLCISFTATVH